MIVEVRGHRLKSLNRMLRGGHPKKRAAERAKELSDLRMLILAQNGPGPEFLMEGRLEADFTHLYCGNRPDVDGYWKLVGDALEGYAYSNDGEIEVLVLRRERVRTRKQQGFIVRLASAAVGLANVSPAGGASVDVKPKNPE